MGSSAASVEIVIGLGTNLPGPAGTPADNLAAAIDAIRREVSGVRLSRALANPAFPPGSGPDFLNAVLIGETALAPERVLDGLMAIERRLGRVRERPWQARPIDLDLLSWGDVVSAGYWAAAAQGDVPPTGTSFILPHPRLHFRRSVLGPLAEIAPDWRHPALGLTAQAMVERLA
jgi:2-amino-4-hydroxy-6-hydroxymethyldihydropteridine diphosphokinase